VRGWPAVLVAAVGFGAAALGIGVHALDSAWAGVDEPQYLFTAISLGEDGSLDIGDELAQERWRAFAQVAPPVQSAMPAGGRQVSPHDPLLPLLLALPVRLGGWLAAKWTLAVLAGLLAAATLALARRLAVPTAVAVPGVVLAAGTAPLAVYGQQVYPELPAALAVTVAAIALTGGRGARGTALAAVAVTALPWLSVKYAPVAAALGVLVLVRAAGRRVPLLAFWALAGAAYLGVHRLLWGGWTVYASGDAFAGTGEFGVVGFHPDYPGRTIRLVGLLVDRGFGLGAWQPAYLLLVPALAWLVTARPPHWPVLAAPLAAGWLNATYVALTMQGYWWPGRQVVVSLPLAVVAILRWVATLGPRARLAAAGLGATGVAIYARVLWVGWAGRTTWVHAPDEAGLHPVIAALLPDDRVLAAGDRVRLALWLAAAGAAAVLAARGGRATRRGRGQPAQPGQAEPLAARAK
jgi:hypothetical protein